MEAKKRLLIVDDEPRMGQILGMLGTRWGFDTRTAASGQAALEALAAAPADVVVTDLKMPGMGGDELLREIRQRHPETAVILMTAHATVKSAVEAMKAGAHDYIMKPFDNDELRLLVERAVEHRALLEENKHLRAELRRRTASEPIIGSSEGIRAVLRLVERVGPTRATVLITGESGVGKELVARAIHAASPRADGPFVALNCAALTETLLESELFGHERGSFTGADRIHRGKFEDAHGGTIFLDEIGETSNNFQTKLLRVLQEGEFERVGGSQTLTVDVRVVAATNRDLEAEVQGGRFREDLYYRLQVVPIHVPPLRERRGDIDELAAHFVRKACEENALPGKILGEEALARLREAPWRGNVRELQNIIERAVILSRDRVIRPDDLLLSTGKPRRAAGVAEDESLEGLPLPDYIDALTRRHILRTLDAHQWRKQEAADALGIDRATLYRMIKRFGIEQP